MTDPTIVGVGSPPGPGPRDEWTIFAEHGCPGLTMRASGRDPGSGPDRLRFALAAERAVPGAASVHLHEEFPGIEFLLAQRVRGRRRRLSMLIHNPLSLRRRLPLRVLRLVPSIDRVLCLSPAAAEATARVCQVDASRVKVVWSRVDTDYFSPAAGGKETESDENLVVSAGAINRDYDLLASATRGLACSVKIAADSAWSYSVKGLPALAGGAPEHVEMRSWGDYRSLRELYARSRLIAVPLRSTRVLSGVSVALEAMAMGRPVIMTRSPLTDGYVQHGVTGLLVPPGDAGALRHAIEELLDDRERAEAMGRAGRARAVACFSLEAYAGRILGALNEAD